MAGGVKKGKILIIDDHIQTAISIAEILAYKGYNAIQAYNAEDGIKICKRENPDLVLLSLHVDGLSQEEFMKEFPKQKYFVVTAEDGDREKVCKSKYCIAVVDKPVDKDTLLEKVKKVLKD